MVGEDDVELRVRRRRAERRNDKRQQADAA